MTGYFYTDIFISYLSLTYYKPFLDCRTTALVSVVLCCQCGCWFFFFQVWMVGLFMMMNRWLNLSRNSLLSMSGNRCVCRRESQLTLCLRKKMLNYYIPSHFNIVKPPYLDLTFCDSFVSTQEYLMDVDVFWYINILSIMTTNPTWPSTISLFLITTLFWSSWLLKKCTYISK